MKKARIIYNLLLIKVVILISLFSCSKKIHYVIDSNTTYKDYIIRTEKMDFHIDDTVINYTVLIRPNGSFYLRYGGNIDTSYITYFSSIKRGKKIEHYREKFVLKTDSLLSLKSYFPILITHDSSVINHYDSPKDFNFNYTYEPEYSLILNNLNEPNLIDSLQNKSIRIIQPIYGSSSYSETPITYSSVRLSINYKNGFLHYSEGKYDSLANFIVNKKDSCQIKEKHIAKINDIIQNIEFDQEYYFAEIGLDIHEKFLIEIKMNEDYYVFERGLLNYYNKNKQLRDLYYNLIWLKMKYLK